MYSNTVASVHSTQICITHDSCEMGHTLSHRRLDHESWRWEGPVNGEEMRAGYQWVLSQKYEGWESTITGSLSCRLLRNIFYLLNDNSQHNDRTPMTHRLRDPKLQCGGISIPELNSLPPYPCQNLSLSKLYTNHIEITSQTKCKSLLIVGTPKLLLKVTHFPCLKRFMRNKKVKGKEEKAGPLFCTQKTLRLEAAV